MNDTLDTPAVIARGFDLTKHFKSGAGVVKAVDGVSFQLLLGSVVALRGPSGCGKSTLLNLIGTLDRADSGRLTVDEINVTGLSGPEEVDYRRRKVGFVFQQFNLVPQLSALENVTLPMELAGFRRNASAGARARDLLGQVGLTDERHARRPAKLSGGEQQRVAIARALANDPPLVLADEPTANLDSKTGARIIQLLLSLRYEGRTVLIATHDDALAKEADATIEMRDGRLVGA